MSPSTSSNPANNPTPKRLLGLALMATGVVCGDIGTSPLYAFRLNFGPEVGLAPTPGKYLLVVLRADDDGEAEFL